MAWKTVWRALKQTKPKTKTIVFFSHTTPEGVSQHKMPTHIPILGNRT